MITIKWHTPQSNGWKGLRKLLGSQPCFISSKILFSMHPGSSYAPPFAKVPYDLHPPLCWVPFSSTPFLHAFL